MATANQASESTISGKAMDLLDCFVSGLDDVILEVAETIAKERQGDVVPIRIESQDVVQAADAFFGQIKDRLGADPSKAQILKTIEGMHQCLRNRCEAQAQQERPT